MHSKIADIEEVCLVEAGYAYLMTSMNRAIPVAISVYRYCLVFHPYFFMTQKPKKILGILLFFYIMGNKINTYVNIFSPNFSLLYLREVFKKKGDKCHKVCFRPFRVI